MDVGVSGGGAVADGIAGNQSAEDGIAEGIVGADHASGSPVGHGQGGNHFEK